jgi:hypothetical protein
MNDRVYLPKTSSWVLAPEWNHRGFSIDAAKKLDVFSFGMLCIWILFKEAILDRGIIVEKAIRMPQKLADQNLSLREGSVECILQDLKVNKKILDAVREIITDTIPEDIRAKHRLQDFFIATLREEQSLRESNFENLISYLDPSQ